MRFILYTIARMGVQVAPNGLMDVSSPGNPVIYGGLKVGMWSLKP